MKGVKDVKGVKGVKAVSGYYTGDVILSFLLSSSDNGKGGK